MKNIDEFLIFFYKNVNGDKIETYFNADSFIIEPY